jgi:hypothetical protein
MLENEIKYYVVSKSLESHIKGSDISGIQNIGSGGGMLLKALVFKIIVKIRAGNILRFKDNDINICFINNKEDIEELKMLIYLLFHEVKNITIVSEKVEELDTLVGEIYYDTGLSISVTSDFENGIRKINKNNIVINLCDFSKSNYDTKAIKNLMLINYGNLNGYCKNAINSLSVKIPEAIKNKLKGEIFGHLTSIEIAEGLIYKEILAKYAPEALQKKEDVLKILCSEFDKNGFDFDLIY